MRAHAEFKRPLISPLRYPGGKGALYPLIKSLIRANGLSGCTYIEPYAGGVGAGLALLVTGEVSRLVVNDLDPHVASLWRALLQDPKEFRGRIESVPLNVGEWERQKSVFLDLNSPEFDRGFASFYLNRTNRSGILNGGPIGGMDQTGNYKIDARFNRSDLSERVRLISLYRSRITVRSENGVDVAREMLADPSNFVYLDPPYFEKAGSLYLNSFKAEDHEQLARMLNSMPKSNWILTYDNVPRVGELYRERTSRQIGLNYSAHRVTRATEILVLSDAITDVMPSEDRPAASVSE